MSRGWGDYRKYSLGFCQKNGEFSRKSRVMGGHRKLCQITHVALSEMIFCLYYVKTKYRKRGVENISRSNGWIGMCLARLLGIERSFVLSPMVGTSSSKSNSESIDFITIRTFFP